MLTSLQTDRNCLYDKHRRRWSNLDKVGEFANTKVKREVLAILTNFFPLPVIRIVKYNFMTVIKELTNLTVVLFCHLPEARSSC